MHCMLMDRLSAVLLVAVATSLVGAQNDCSQYGKYHHTMNMCHYHNLFHSS